MQNLPNKLARLTARLDHMVPDPKLSAGENQAAAATLSSLASKLHALLPDASLSSEERLERLARVVVGRIPDPTKLTPASEKVRALTERLDQLVPGAMSPEDKIDQLVSLAMQAVPDPGLAVVARLEKLGDADAGIAPVA